MPATSLGWGNAPTCETRGCPASPRWRMHFAFGPKDGKVETFIEVCNHHREAYRLRAEASPSYLAAEDLRPGEE